MMFRAICGEHAGLCAKEKEEVNRYAPALCSESAW
jgi:hypothetical protein